MSWVQVPSLAPPLPALPAQLKDAARRTETARIESGIEPGAGEKSAGRPARRAIALTARAGRHWRGVRVGRTGAAQHHRAVLRHLPRLAPLDDDAPRRWRGGLAGSVHHHRSGGPALRIRRGREAWIAQPGNSEQHGRKAPAGLDLGASGVWARRFHGTAPIGRSASNTSTAVRRVSLP